MSDAWLLPPLNKEQNKIKAELLQRLFQAEIWKLQISAYSIVWSNF